MNSVQAVIFDLDGVIVDSEPRHERAYRELFSDLGYADRHGIDFHAYYGSSDRALLTDFIARHHPTQSLEELLALKQRKALRLLTEEEPLFHEIPDLVARLAQRYLLGVASGSVPDTIRTVLAMDNIGQFFRAVVSVVEVPRGKPAPDLFLECARRLGIAPVDCCVIEDSEFGVQAARAAGMQAIAITNTLPASRLTLATHVVQTYPEIERLLLPPA
jgi:HAD superfamily hydrolase (TIGR01509 family)